MGREERRMTSREDETYIALFNEMNELSSETVKRIWKESGGKKNDALH